MLRELYDGPAALEPRHVSRFGEQAQSLLWKFRVAQVAADPALVPEAAHPLDGPVWFIPPSWVSEAVLFRLF